MSFRDNSGKEIRKRTGMAWKNVRFWDIYWLKIPKTKTSWIPLYFPSYSGRRSMVTLGEGTEDAPNLSAEVGTENVAWSDRVTNAEIRKRNNTKNMVAVAYSLKWKW
jgi:hypothetical protein